MNKSFQDQSIVSLQMVHGSSDGSKCGYCDGTTDKSCQWGMGSKRTLTADYEELMKKGWRRCGEYYYRPDIASSCCSLNTIRLKAEDYQPSKKQK